MKNAKQTECQVEESTRRYSNIFLVNLAQICPEFYAHVIHDCAVYIRDGGNLHLSGTVHNKQSRKIDWCAGL